MADIQHTQTHPKFTSSDKTDGQKPLDLIQSVKKSAMYHWENLLPACGIDIPAKGKHGACSICGGTDRFHFIDDHHNGNWHCRQCDAPNYGDGLDLVAKTKGISILAAAKIIANVLALPLPEPKPAKETIQIQPIAEKVAALMAQTVVGKPPYLTAKGLYCSNQRLLKDGSLLLPLRTLDKEITGAQIIKPDGTKKLLSGSQKKSAFIALSEMEEHPGTVIITEGYATALTISQLHQGTILAAIDAGNLLSVAQSVREHWPDTKIIIAADNDWHLPDELDKNGKPKKNVGKIAAEKTAKIINGWVTLPPTEYKADWDDYRQQHRVEIARQAFIQGLYQPTSIKKKAAVQLNNDTESSKLTLCQMGASQRGEVLLARYNGDLALDGASETVHHYDGIVWRPVSDRDLRREMVAAFMEEKLPYSPHGISSAVDALKLQLPMMQPPEHHLIGFSNGVFDLKACQFRPHRKNDWLLLANDVEFNSPVSGETLQDHAPQFWR